MLKNSIAQKYTYRVGWSEEDQAHIAQCLEMPSLLAHGVSAQIALQEIETVVAETIQWMIEDREDVPLPFGMRKPWTPPCVPNLALHHASARRQQYGSI
jgi:predicted RNase H-like HicB family nuclease